MHVQDQEHVAAIARQLPNRAPSAPAPVHSGAGGNHPIIRVPNPWSDIAAPAPYPRAHKKPQANQYFAREAHKGRPANSPTFPTFEPPKEEQPDIGGEALASAVLLTALEDCDPRNANRLGCGGNVGKVVRDARNFCTAATGDWAISRVVWCDAAGVDPTYFREWALHVISLIPAAVVVPAVVEADTTEAPPPAPLPVTRREISLPLSLPPVPTQRTRRGFDPSLLTRVPRLSDTPKELTPAPEPEPPPLPAWMSSELASLWGLA